MQQSPGGASLSSLRVAIAAEVEALLLDAVTDEIKKCRDTLHSYIEETLCGDRSAAAAPKTVYIRLNEHAPQDIKRVVSSFATIAASGGSGSRVSATRHLHREEDYHTDVVVERCDSSAAPNWKNWLTVLLEYILLNLLVIFATNCQSGYIVFSLEMAMLAIEIALPETQSHWFDELLYSAHLKMLNASSVIVDNRWHLIGGQLLIGSNNSPRAPTSPPPAALSDVNSNGISIRITNFLERLNTSKKAKKAESAEAFPTPARKVTRMELPEVFPTPTIHFPVLPAPSPPKAAMQQPVGSVGDGRVPASSPSRRPSNATVSGSYLTAFEEKRKATSPSRLSPCRLSSSPTALFDAAANTPSDVAFGPPGKGDEKPLPAASILSVATPFGASSFTVLAEMVVEQCTDPTDCGEEPLPGAGLHSPPRKADYFSPVRESPDATPLSSPSRTPQRYATRPSNKVSDIVHCFRNGSRVLVLAHFSAGSRSRDVNKRYDAIQRLLNTLARGAFEKGGKYSAALWSDRLRWLGLGLDQRARWMATMEEMEEATCDLQKCLPTGGNDLRDSLDEALRRLHDATDIVVLCDDNVIPFSPLTNSMNLFAVTNWVAFCSRFKKKKFHFVATTKHSEKKHLKQMAHDGNGVFVVSQTAPKTIYKSLFQQ